MTNENPFKIISPTEEAPQELRGEVMSSVKLAMLLMRFLQLFMADYANALFENFRLFGPDGSRRKDRDQA